MGKAACSDPIALVSAMEATGAVYTTREVWCVQHTACYFSANTRSQSLTSARVHFSHKAPCLYLEIVSIDAGWLWENCG